MSVLEWLLIVEAVLLLTAGLFWLFGAVIGKSNDPDDLFTRFYRTFWKVFLRRRGRLRTAVSALDVEKARQYESMKQEGDVDGIKQLLMAEFGEHAFDESDIHQAVADQPGADDSADASAEAAAQQSAVINITVIPFSPRDELVSVRSDGVTIQTTAGAEEGQANKAVIDVLAAALGVKGYRLTLLKGHYKAQKQVQIAGYDQHQLDQKLASFS
ncbi:MAG: DUF167 domain-containing protein [Tepidisphaeraceae bacterium]